MGLARGSGLPFSAEVWLLEGVDVDEATGRLGEFAGGLFGSKARVRAFRERRVGFVWSGAGSGGVGVLLRKASFSGRVLLEVV